MDFEPIELRFRYEEIDYVRALRAHYRTVLHVSLDVAGIALGLACGAYLATSANMFWPGVGLILLMGLLALMILSAFFIIPQVQFRREVRFRDWYELRFSNDGIYFRTLNIKSELRWSLYSRALVDAHSYVLYYGKSTFTVIPKRYFQDPEQLARFDRLVEEKIATIVRPGRARS